MDATTCRQLADRFLAQMNGGPLEEDLYTADATMWHNTDETDHPVAAREGIRLQIMKMIPDWQFSEPQVHAYDGGFAVQYVVTGTLPGDAALRIPACTVGTCRDGRIARLQEYVDSAGLAAVRAAFAAQAATK